VYFPEKKKRWAGHVARMWERRGAYGTFMVTIDGKRPHSESPGVYGEIILKRIFKIQYR